jgi:NAD(P)-dependent dehydrogenase (short-subunit alcohol dehydrogenase family)
MFEGTTAFVTGASRGIGRAIATRFVEDGGTATIAARSDAIYDVAEELGEDRALAVETDVSSERDVEGAIRATVDEFGGLDVLVNNAAIAGPTAPVEEVATDDWQRTLDVNLTGAFLTVKHAVPHLVESDRGTVVNVSSITGKRPLPERTPYAATKIALVGLTRTLAFELGDEGVTVNTICPGTVRTERLRRVFERHAEELGVTYQEALDELVLDDCAIRELQEPEEIAGVVAFLASDHGRHITAQDINVDSGATWY